MQKKSNGQISAKNDRRMPNNWGLMKGFFRLLLGYLSFSLKKNVDQTSLVILDFFFYVPDANLFPCIHSSSPSCSLFPISFISYLLYSYLFWLFSPIWWPIYVFTWGRSCHFWLRFNNFGSVFDFGNLNRWNTREKGNREKIQEFVLGNSSINPKKWSTNIKKWKFNEFNSMSSIENHSNGAFDNFNSKSHTHWHILSRMLNWLHNKSSFVNY